MDDPKVEIAEFDRIIFEFVDIHWQGIPCTIFLADFDSGIRYTRNPWNLPEEPIFEAMKLGEKYQHERISYFLHGAGVTPVWDGNKYFMMNYLLNPRQTIGFIFPLEYLYAEKEFMIQFLIICFSMLSVFNFIFITSQKNGFLNSFTIKKLIQLVDFRNLKKSPSSSVFRRIHQLVWVWEYSRSFPFVNSVPSDRPLHWQS